jgi:septal ring factor EnvC (AmiA/AmiB activator)
MALFNIIIRGDYTKLERSLERIEAHLKFIIKQQKEMAQEINAYLDRVEAALTNIKQDIQDIKDGLPPSGGLTAEQVAQIKERLSAVVTSAESLDAENTRPEVPPTPEA